METIEQVGRYRIVDELGRGGMGVVYRATDTMIEREVALKVTRRPGQNASAAAHEVYARFLREARAAGSLSHPGIVTIFDVGEDEASDYSFIAMELVVGESLDNVLRRREGLGYDKVRDIGQQVATALEAAHAVGIVHRDIKPGNLILTKTGRVKVTDFGIAKIEDQAMTGDGTMLGSPRYMAPEQVNSARVDHRTDIYALGTVLYELATLKPAYVGKDLIDLLRTVAEGRLTPPRELRPDLPEQLDAAIVKAMARDANRRFATATEMREALEAGPSSVDLEPQTHATMVIDTPMVLAEKSAERPASDAPDRALGDTRPKATSKKLLLGAALATALALLGWLGTRTDSAVNEIADAQPDKTQQQVASTGRLEATSTSDGSTESAGPSAPAIEPDAAALTAPETPFEVPYVVRSKHRHRVGSCEGVIRLYPTHIEYDVVSGEHKDDRVWAYAKLRDLSYDSGRSQLKLTEAARDKNSLGLQHKNYRFDLLDEPSARTIAWLLQRPALR